MLCGVHNVKTSLDVWYILATEDDRDWGIKSCCVSTRSEWLSHLSGMGLWYDIVGTSSVSFVLSAFCIFDTFSTSFPVCVILLSSRLLTVLLYRMCQIYSIGMTSGNVMSCMFYCIYSVGRGCCPALQLTWGSHSSPAINVVCYRSLECIHIKCENEQVVRNK